MDERKSPSTIAYLALVAIGWLISNSFIASCIIPATNEKTVQQELIPAGAFLKTVDARQTNDSSYRTAANQAVLRYLNSLQQADEQRAIAQFKQSLNLQTRVTADCSDVKARRILMANFNMMQRSGVPGQISGIKAEDNR